MIDGYEGQPEQTARAVWPEVIVDGLRLAGIHPGDLRSIPAHHDEAACHPRRAQRGRFLAGCSARRPGNLSRASVAASGPAECRIALAHAAAEAIFEFTPHQRNTMPKFTSHIFVCCNQRDKDHKRGSCDPDGKQKLRDCFKKELKRRDLGPLVRANEAGCLDQCELGPTIVIYPQEIWYGNVQIEDVPRIIEETIVGGRVLEDLLIPTEDLNARKKK